MFISTQQSPILLIRRDFDNAESGVNNLLLPKMNRLNKISNDFVWIFHIITDEMILSSK